MSYAQKTVVVDVDRVGGYHGAHSEGGTVQYSQFCNVQRSTVQHGIRAVVIAPMMAALFVFPPWFLVPVSNPLG